MTRLIVDVSSLVKRCLFAGSDEENGYEVEFEGKTVKISSHHFGYDNSINSVVMVLDQLHLTPSDMILVVEGKNSKTRRLQIYKEYKAGKGRAPEWNNEFNQARDRVVTALRHLGATVVQQDSTEADDVIAYLCEKLPGNLVILSEDGDLAQLMNDRVSMWRQGQHITENPYGPFPCKHIHTYKALVGDSSDNIKGAVGFGEKAWLDLLVNYGDCLDALADLIATKKLGELADDAAEFKPFRKVIDSAESVYLSWVVSQLRSDWVNTVQLPLTLLPPESGPLEDHRLSKFEGKAQSANHADIKRLIEAQERKRSPYRRPLHAIFDTEILGKDDPVFLTCVRIHETGEQFSFWWHREGDMVKLNRMLERDDLTWVSFNGINFDDPVMSAAIYKKPPSELKKIADAIINGNMKPWECEAEFGFSRISFDHIDLCEVAPGVRISLKAYAGRLGYPTMQDLPFEHDQDLTAEQLQMVEDYCFNDIGVTEALFKKLATEIELRRTMSDEYGIDLRSKSDAQIAEAVLRSELGIRKAPERKAPKFVKYVPPAFIQTDSPVILELIEKLKAAEFKINFANGSPEAPDFLNDPIELGFGTYKVGIGGLHSTHDSRRYVVADEQREVSDFDVASYYPNIILNAGIIPSFDGNAAMGRKFIDVYRSILESRLADKRKSQEVKSEIKRIRKILEEQDIPS